MTDNKEKYNSFAEDFAKYMAVNHPGVCFYGFGSFFNNPDVNPRDLDGGLITENIFTDKEEISEISGKMLDLAKEKGIQYSPVKFQFNLVDRISGNDGRFLSYDSTYTTFLKNHGKVLSGPEGFLEDLNGIQHKHNELGSFAHNFRLARNDFLHSQYFFETDSGADKLIKLRDYLEACPKKLNLIEILRTYPEQADEIIAEELSQKSKKDFVSQAKSRFLEFDWNLFDKISNAGDSDFKKTSKQNLMSLWGEALSVFEGFVNLGIKEYPVIKREAVSFI